METALSGFYFNQMAQRRMFSLQIVDTDAFLEMPISSQLLYFHLTMRADDEGFVGNPRKIARLVGVNDDDFKVLIAKRFILAFEGGVVVIKHWLIHNTIRMDRFKSTTYQEQKNQLAVKENRAYTESGNQMATSRQPKLSKVNIREDKREVSEQAPTPSFREKFIKEIGNPNKEGEKFIAYWTEKSPNGKKERWQMQRVFDIRRRYSTWLEKASQFGGEKDNKFNVIKL